MVVNTQTPHWTRTVIRLCLVVLTLVASLPIYALSLEATVDTNEVTEGDSLILTVTIKDQAFGSDPDFTPLEENFTIASKYPKRMVRNINGQIDSSVVWTLTLFPKNKGYVVIPPIQLDKLTTKPITVKVVARTQNNATKNSDTVFIEASVDKDTAYVQEQIILKLRLYKRTQIIDANWPPPKVPNAVVESLSDARVFQTTVGKYTYNVTEYSFAVFPQKSGKLDIPASKLVATIGSAGRSGFFYDPFSSGKQIVRETQPITLNVKPIPKGYPKASWLPSPSVALGDKWSEKTPTFTVGEAITRTVILQAKGLTATTLPNLPLPKGDQFKIYPDKTDTRTNVDVDGILSQRVSSYAFIPTQPGKITLPAITVSWWDIDQDKLQTATLPAQTINVEPASGEQGNATPTPAEQRSDKALNPASDLEQTPGIWKPLAFALGALWLLTLGGGWWFFKQRATTGNTQLNAPKINMGSAKRVKKQLEQACENHGAKSASEALLAWGKLSFDTTFHSLGELRQKLEADTNAAPLVNALRDLEQHLYQPSAPSWNGTQLWQAFSSFDTLHKESTKTADSNLEPLHRI